MSIIVIEFITLDGIVSDPDGSTPAGGWAFRHGPEAVAGDRFQLGSVLDEGILLLGCKTWQLFSRIWPGRDDEFSTRMNAVPKLVASRTLADASAWANSQLIGGDPIDAVKGERRDVIIMGSLSVAHSLISEGLIDEYRLLAFPTILAPASDSSRRQPAHPPGMPVGRAVRRRRPRAVPEGSTMTARFLPATTRPPTLRRSAPAAPHPYPLRSWPARLPACRSGGMQIGRLCRAGAAGLRSANRPAVAGRSRAASSRLQSCPCPW